jgi:hypothetical protein
MLVLLAVLRLDAFGVRVGEDVDTVFLPERVDPGRPA